MNGKKIGCGCLTVVVALVAIFFVAMKSCGGETEKNKVILGLDGTWKGDDGSTWIFDEAAGKVTRKQDGQSRKVEFTASRVYGVSMSYSERMVKMTFLQDGSLVMSLPVNNLEVDSGYLDFRLYGGTGTDIDTLGGTWKGKRGETSVRFTFDSESKKADYDLNGMKGSCSYAGEDYGIFFTVKLPLGFYEEPVYVDYSARFADSSTLVVEEDHGGRFTLKRM